MGGFVMFDRNHAPGCADCALYRRSLVALLAAFNAGVLITNDEAAPEQVESLFGLLESLQDVLPAPVPLSVVEGAL